MSDRPDDSGDSGISPSDHETAEVIRFPTRDVAPPASVREAIGQVVRRERLDQERTLIDVAHDAAVSVGHLSELERGRTEASSEVIEAVGRALGMEPADVLERAAGRLRLGSGRSGGATLLAA